MHGARWLLMCVRLLFSWTTPIRCVFVLSGSHLGECLGEDAGTGMKPLVVCVAVMCSGVAPNNLFSCVFF